MIYTNFWDSLDKIDGYRIKQVIGVVYGTSIKNRSFLGNLLSGMKSVVGGKQQEYIDMTNQVREESLQIMVEDAVLKNANAVIGVRFTVSEVILGGIPMEEVTAYGTAVILENEG